MHVKTSSEKDLHDLVSSIEMAPMIYSALQRISALMRSGLMAPVSVDQRPVWRWPHSPAAFEFERPAYGGKADHQSGRSSDTGREGREWGRQL